MSTATAKHPKENIARLAWIAFVLMFFVLQACLWTFAISMTAGDKSHAVVSGYDKHALTWDEVKQAKAESDGLGWSSEILVGDKAGLPVVRSLHITLRDANGAPVEGASLKVMAFHRAAAAEPQNVNFTEAGPGVYSTTIIVEKFGKWCFEGTASLGESKYLIDETIELFRPNQVENQ